MLLSQVFISLIFGFLVNQPTIEFHHLPILIKRPVKMFVEIENHNIPLFLVILNREINFSIRKLFLIMNRTNNGPNMVVVFEKLLLLPINVPAKYLV